jgi:hypothetical protein
MRLSTLSLLTLLVACGADKSDTGASDTASSPGADVAVDVRSETAFDEYAIGEGTFEAQGEYGPQVWTTGAVVVAKPDACD